MSVLIHPAIYAGATGAITTSAGLATTYTGLVLTNPIGSPVTLTVEQVSIAPIVAQAAARIIGLMVGYSGTTAQTQTTPITPTPVAPVGAFSGSGAGLLASAATITTPTLAMLLGELDTGAITVVTANIQVIPMRNNNGDPLIVIPPGGYVAFYTSTASTASSLAFSFTWGEYGE